VKEKPVTFGGQSGFAWPVFASQRPVPTSSGEQKNEKERCREVRFAHERREREKLEEHQTDFVRPVPAVPGLEPLFAERCTLRRAWTRWLRQEAMLE